MKRFAALYRELDASTATREKQAALQRYFSEAPAEDAAWSVYFLAGGKPRQTVPTRALRELAQAATGLPEWLFEESYQTVGDLAETVSLLLPPATAPVDRGLAEWLTQHLLPLRGLPTDVLTERLRAQWDTLPDDQRFVYFKLITGGFRVGVSKLQVTQALAAVAGVDAKRVAQRLMGYTHIGAQPSAADYAALVVPESPTEKNQQTSGQPYPFFLAHPFNDALERFDQLLGPPADWQVEWKWDGIRAQLVQRAGQVWLWSRGEELVTERFPELAALGEALPEGTVLDGEVVVWREGKPQPFAELQKRIGRKTLGPKILRELPVALLAYDLLEHNGQDLREQPLHTRRSALDALVQDLNHPLLIASPLLTGDTWAQLAALREEAPRTRHRGLHAQAAQQRLRRGPHQGRGHLVEVEDRPDERGRGADLRPARPRPPRQRVQRLHLRRVERTARHRRPRARALRQSLLGPVGRRDGQGRCHHPRHHHRELWPGAQRAAHTGV